jgi:putative ABC transport system permease protein
MLDGRNRTVIGIMPAGFQFPHSSFRFAEPADIWLPLVFTPEQITERRGRYNLNVLARLKTGVTLEQARSDMDSLGSRLEQQHTGYRGPNGEDGGWRVTVEQLKEEVVGSSRRPLWVLFGAVGLILLIACANVVSLSLARSAGRRQEIAVRSAIGASRGRLVAQLMSESLLLALIGGSVGLLLAIWAIDLLVRLAPSNIPRLAEVSIDGRVLFFTLVVTLLTTILSGLIPALRLSKPDLVEAMKETRPGTTLRSGHRLGSLIVAGEIALAVLVIVSAGLMIRSFRHLMQVEPGFNTDNLLAVELSLPASRYADGPPVADFYSRLSERINALPGVESVGMAALVPLGGAAIDDPFSIEGRPLDPSNLTTAGHQTISPNLFRTLGVRFGAGRDFTPGDASGASAVAIINRQMADTYWPNEDPIGRRIKLGAPRAPTPWSTIVGIVENLPHRGLGSQARPDWFMPHAQSPARDMVLIVRSKLPAETLTTDIRLRLSELDPDQPVTRAETINRVISDSVSDRRFSVELLTLFAAVALVLASVGAYGLISFSVAQRTQELSVRLALGAQTRDIIGLVMKQGALIIAGGIIVGLIAAFAATRVMSNLLFNVSTTDPATFIAASLLLGGLSLLACYIPARRASRTDTIRILR